jgi:hypothetical protein
LSLKRDTGGNSYQKLEMGQSSRVQCVPKVSSFAKTFRTKTFLEGMEKSHEQKIVIGLLTCEPRYGYFRTSRAAI